MSVIILNVEPGGWRSSRPIPATARICPVAGAIATIPPSWPPRAVTAACCTDGDTVVRTALAAFGVAVASTRAPVLAPAFVLVPPPSASSSPPGVPRRLASSASSRPLTPTIAFAGTPSASNSCRRAAGIGPTVPTTALANEPSGEARWPASTAAPSASTVPSRASSVARRGQRRVARQPLAGAQARERERARPGDPRSRAAALHRQREVAGERSEQARLYPHRHRHRAARGAAGLAGHAQAGRGRGRGGERAAVGARELARRHFAPGADVDVRVHARVVAPRPGGGEPFGERVRVGGGMARAGDRADREGEARERDHAAGTAAP